MLLSSDGVGETDVEVLVLFLVVLVEEKVERVEGRSRHLPWCFL
jgi:hypothetical protein